MREGIFLALVHNASLLLALALVYDLLTVRWRSDASRWKQVAVGMIVGGIGLALMLSSFTLETGIIFDTRSILLGVSGLFFGTVPTVVAMAMTAALRLWQGGAAAATGVSVILASGLIGLGWRYRRRSVLADVGWKELYALGIVVHVTMLALMLTLGLPKGLRVLREISFPVLVIYPLATAALGLLMSNRLRRQQDADRLRESEERIRATLYGIGDGVLVTDAAGHVTRLNRVAEELTGIREEDAAGLPIGEVLRLRDEETGGEVGDPVRAVLEGAEGPPIERRGLLLARDGAERPVLGSVAPVHGPGGEVAGAVVIVRDQTAEKLRQEAARERESVFRALFEQRAVGVTHVDTRTGRFLRVNDRFAEILGYTPEEVRALSFQDVTHPDDLPSDRARVEALLAGRMREYTIDKRYVRKDGSVVWVTLSLSPMWAPGDPPSTHIAMVLDVTERKGAEEKLADLNADLERRVARRTELLTEANRELEAFSYSVSHDLRAPLRAIDGFSRILAEEYAPSLDDEGKRLLGVVSENARKMGRLIDDLLAFSRSSRSEIRRTRVDMAELARAAFAEARSAGVSADRVELRMGELPPAEGDASLLRQVWANLVGNAVKFSAGAERPVVEIDRSTDGDRVVYWVRDNGAGFDMAYAQKLFGVFQRLHAPGEFPGTGVGLALARRIVTRHWGEIRGEGAVGRGATFSFSLPRNGPPSGHGRAKDSGAG